MPLDSPRGALLEGPTLDRLSFGLAWQEAEREFLAGGGRLLELDHRSYEMQLGIDLASWLTLYGGAGFVEVKAASRESYGEAESFWRVGLQFNLLEFEMRRDVPERGVFRIGAEVDFRDIETNFRSDIIQWDALDAALLFSFDLATKRTFRDIAQPTTTSFYLGPVLSELEGTIGGEGGEALNESHDAGLVLGVDTVISDHIQAGLEVRVYDGASYHFALGYHF